MPRCRFAVYLIHFEQPYKHAKHYLGATTLGVAARLAKHETEQGARLLQVVRAAGIGYDVVVLGVEDPESVAAAVEAA